ncbi:hypothetical protein [Chroococcidiopsis sp. CCALA 051]|uniref:hypothetical protein n=1 Tax=Chroococcidiopsis sp. CCALA 051 TaxID=869949 RepID=UPI001304DA69|nr:hypothetical protein [Chroococcidiopsis sp. CCALA 051]
MGVTESPAVAGCCGNYGDVCGGDGSLGRRGGLRRRGTTSRPDGSLCDDEARVRWSDDG